MRYLYLKYLAPTAPLNLECEAPLRVIIEPDEQRAQMGETTVAMSLCTFKRTTHCTVGLHYYCFEFNHF